MDDGTIMYRAYLLRLWGTPGAGWRATLEDPSTGQRRAKWFAPDKAARRVLEPELKGLIRDFEPAA